MSTHCVQLYIFKNHVKIEYVIIENGIYEYK